MNVTIDLDLLNAALAIIGQSKPETIGQMINAAKVVEAIQASVNPQIQVAQQPAPEASNG